LEALSPEVWSVGVDRDELEVGVDQYSLLSTGEQSVVLLMRALVGG
jgi:ABC-type molybdenum transport system ATPase subunit/photorepair protein PhrA